MSQTRLSIINSCNVWNKVGPQGLRLKERNKLMGISGQLAAHFTQANIISLNVFFFFFLFCFCFFFAFAYVALKMHAAFSRRKLHIPYDILYKQKRIYYPWFHVISLKLYQVYNVRPGLNSLHQFQIRDWANVYELKIYYK